MDKPSPVILTAMGLEVHYGDQIVLNNASLSIHEEDRIGLLGKNGAGKSTFLKVISGLQQPDSGEVTKKKDLVIGFLSQDFTLYESKSVYENIVDGAKDIIKMLEQYETLPHNSSQWHILEEKIKQKDGWNLNRNIDLLIDSLNAPKPEMIVGLLSGGEKRRVSLCRALISHPDLLILDEPTNHLDTRSIEWIEKFLSDYQGTCIFVTHDRYFLDRIATRIVELSNGTFYSHQGNYTDYLLNKAEREIVKEVEERKKSMFLRRELEWVLRGPRARRSKSKSRLSTYDKISSEVSNEKELDIDLIIPPAEQLGKKILELHNVGISLGGKELFHYLNLTFEQGRKLGIVGRNGVGKTTLLKVLTEAIKPDEGRIEKGERTEFNYIDQERLLLNEEETVIETIAGKNSFIRFGKFNLTVYSYLKRFLFTDDRIVQKVKSLSGGERSRLALAKILKDGGNFLILDEPTNDLDLPSLRVLEEALIAFEGCLVVVSHDRYFLNRVCNGILAFEENSDLYMSEGDYDYYIQKRQDRLNPEIKQKEKKEDTRVKSKLKKLSWKENKEFEDIEENIILAESEVERIEMIFSDENFYEKYGNQTVELTKQLADAKEKVDYLYKRWNELENKKNED